MAIQWINAHGNHTNISKMFKTWSINIWKKKEKNLRKANSNKFKIIRNKYKKKCLSIHSLKNYRLAPRVILKNLNRKTFKNKKYHQLLIIRKKKRSICINLQNRKIIRSNINLSHLKKISIANSTHKRKYKDTLVTT